MNICKYFQNIQTVDYEDDLDLCYLSIVSQGEDGLQGNVHLHDNHTGQLIKEIPLTEHCKDVNYIMLYSLVYAKYLLRRLIHTFCNVC